MQAALRDKRGKWAAECRLQTAEYQRRRH